jgi:hypothetical protein
MQALGVVKFKLAGDRLAALALVNQPYAKSPSGSPTELDIATTKLAWNANPGPPSLQQQTTRIRVAREGNRLGMNALEQR